MNEHDHEHGFKTALGHVFVSFYPSIRFKKLGGVYVCTKYSQTPKTYFYTAQHHYRYIHYRL